MSTEIILNSIYAFVSYLCTAVGLMYISPWLKTQYPFNATPIFDIPSLVIPGEVPLLIDIMFILLFLVSFANFCIAMDSILAHFKPKTPRVIILQAKKPFITVK